MEIIVKVTAEELDEMGVSQDELKTKLYEQLEEAILPGNMKSLSLAGYNLTVEIPSKTVKKKGFGSR